jgi:hypothetical protein
LYAAFTLPVTFASSATTRILRRINAALAFARLPEEKTLGFHERRSPGVESRLKSSRSFITFLLHQCIKPQLILAPLGCQSLRRHPAIRGVHGRIALIVIRKAGLTEFSGVPPKPFDGFMGMGVLALKEFKRSLRPPARVLIANGRASAPIAEFAAGAPVAAIAHGVSIAGLPPTLAFCRKYNSHRR